MPCNAQRLVHTITIVAFVDVHRRAIDTVLRLHCKHALVQHISGLSSLSTGDYKYLRSSS